MSPLDERDDKLVVYLRDDYRRVGAAFAKWGALVGIPLGLASPFLWREEIILAGIFSVVVAVTAGVFCLVGLLFWAMNKGQVTVDPGAGQVTFAGGRVVAFADLAAVHLSSYVHVQRSQNGSTESVRYQLQLAHSQADPEATEQLRALRAALDEAVASGEVGFGEADADEVRTELQRLGPLLTGMAEVVADHGDELGMWRAAERLAEAMDLPLLDFAGQELLMRSPAELDIPLTRRLHASEKQPEDPGPAPEGLEVSTEPESLEVDWKVTEVLSLVLILLALSTFIVLAICVFTGDVPPGVLMGLTAGVVATALPAMILMATAPSRKLWVSVEGVRFKPGRAREATIPLGALEAVRVSTELDNRVVFLSDDAFIRATFKTEEQARWVGAAATRIIARLAVRVADGPYR